MGPGCALQCPHALGLACGGHGNCTAAGACLCAPGHCGPACGTEGPPCTRCPGGTWGPDCGRRCPGPSGGAVCAGHGQCLDGALGTGACVCDAGYGGPACSRQCPTVDALVCAGHGHCLAATAACLCDAAHAGPACETPCPRRGATGLPCGGPARGVCAGNGRCACRAGYAGRACEAACPRPAGGLCAGHGTCDDQGRCVCELGWGRADCTACVPGYHGGDCRLPCAHGRSVGGMCVCDSGWAGPNCSVACAGGPAWPCHGHGTCRQGHAGDGSCMCQRGWAGAQCDVACTGGPARPCSNRGYCSPADGSCQCPRNGTGGYWAGPACEHCLRPWLGPNCDTLCPTGTSGVPCSGHGACNVLPVCECHTDPVRGHFAGSVCAACAPGYHGASCQAECPGGACRPCSGHGVCDDGLTGTGRCTCMADAMRGFFGGADCSNCAPGVYGPGCKLHCPGAPAAACHGHGHCSDDVGGSGRCLCHRNATAGYWAGVACTECYPGYYGPQCTAACPSQGGRVCAGRGTCDDGRQGSGRCACSPLAHGEACAGTCALGRNGAPCSGHGTCGAAGVGAGACHCAPRWAGAVCDACAPGFVGLGCDVRCPDCSGHGACTADPDGRVHCSCAVGWGGARCDVACPGAPALLCNGHGLCQANGTCVCTRSAEAGHWAGPDCLTCAAGHTGPSCRSACPSGADGRMCSGHGQCVAGQCVCSAGACGPACAASDCAALQCPDPAAFGPTCGGRCPRTPGGVCGGHGLCDGGRSGSGVCLCVGAWSGPACAVRCPGQPHACHRRGLCDSAAEGCVCLPGFAGPDCALQCPGGWHSPCSAHGFCRDGAAGNATCACAPGYGGPACESTCPGGNSTPCHGRGECRTDPSDGALLCMCAEPWGGVACEACMPGRWGPDCAGVCRRGATRGRLCVCDAGWAGEDCSRACAGGAATACSGHGVCNDTRAGDGSCRCESGWLGQACNTPCPGALGPTGLACSGHGQCLADGSCACDASDSAGHWTGPSCSGCLSGYFGGGCTWTCPKGSAEMCGGHGQCDPTTETCMCAMNPLEGFWSEDSNCTECAPAYYGPACQYKCGGGGVNCAACSGHGTCDAGRLGTGRCVCDAQWQGPACSQCAAGWYGRVCARRCPLDAAGRVCSDRGMCRDGLLGLGDCVCAQSWAGGFWAGESCADCLEGFAGENCTVACPGPRGRPCHSHGICSDGRSGTGDCTCLAGYGGPACGLSCPSATDVPCSGHGACDDGAAGTLTCNCSAAAYGRWTGAGCAACADGWVGEACDLLCPASASGALCAGHGSCYAAGPTAAACACAPGFAGPVCASECPGGRFFVCQGHGHCSPNTAACECFADAQRGFWAGPECGTCAAGWSGPGCRTPCPRGRDGVPCSGAGACYAGFCFCSDGVCGPTCNVTGPECSAYHCPDGRYGAGCEGVCPAGAQSPCAGHGTCVSMTYSTGLCRCDAGYSAADCASLCPGGPGRPCSGHGACDDATAQCQCHPTYGGAACRARCPVEDGALCGGHGTCNDTAEGDGRCVCAEGYAGAACNLTCPGFDVNRPDSQACHGNGQCDRQTAACACHGRHVGRACDACTAGYHGPACAATCVHGTTAGQTCICRAGFGGGNCERACPGPPGRPCHGHGLCHARNATCACGADYYGPACGVFCRPELCFHATAASPAPHAQCNAATGACECQDNRFGHWQGALCNECRFGYWGRDCARLCPCSGHGACGMLDGVCACFADAQRGHWFGEFCGQCAPGYLAPRCRARGIAISRTDELPAFTAAPWVAGRGVVLVDEEAGVLYTGGRPLWAIRVADGAAAARMDLGGVVRSATLVRDSVALLVEDTATGATSLWSVSRGLNATVLGPPVAAGVPAAARFRVQSAAAAPWSGVYHSDGRVCLASVALGALHVACTGPASGPQRALSVPAADFPLDVARSAVLWAHPASGPVLLIAGASAGRWGLAAVALRTLSGAASLSDDLRISECRGQCRALAGTAFLDNALLLALEHPAAIVLVRVHVPSLLNFSSARVEQTMTLDWPGADIRGTALIVDPLTRAAFLASHVPSRPSVVYKVRTALRPRDRVRKGRGNVRVAAHQSNFLKASCQMGRVWNWHGKAVQTGNVAGFAKGKPSEWQIRGLTDAYCRRPRYTRRTGG